MMSFAIPGTVIGVAYILAFNVPPVSLTGTGTIIAIAFVFRNMPVGIRAGLANLSQIDRSLDEASLTLGAHSFGTLDARHPADAAAGDRHRDGLQLRARGDRGECGDLPGHRATTISPRSISSAAPMSASTAWRSSIRRCWSIFMMLVLLTDPVAGRRAPHRPARRGAGRRGTRHRIGADMSDARRRVPFGQQALRRGHRARYHQPVDRARHAGDAARSIRLRQDDASCG